jgi:predicted transposase YbfD/YdcC
MEMIQEEDKRWLQESLSRIEDPRRQWGNIRHKLIDMLVIPFVAVLSGLTEWDEIREFAEQKLDWFKSFLELPGGLPCWKTFERLYERLEPIKVAEALQRWLIRMEGRGGRQINIDGKTQRGSGNGPEHDAYHIVTAWYGEGSLALGQVKTEEKSNEITAIPELLDILDIEGDTVTLDAMGCQKAIAEKIIKKKADYVLAVKENQPELHRQIKEYFEWVESEDWAPETVEVWQSGSEKDHGRIERRECAVAENTDWLYQKKEWKNMKTIVRSRLYCTKKDKNSGEWLEPTVNDRYYISSLDISAEEMGKIIRNHWSVENNLHWVLDVIFNEDKSKMRKGHTPQIFNIFKKMAIALIRQREPNRKKSYNTLMTRSLLNDDYRHFLIFNK